MIRNSATAIVQYAANRNTSETRRLHRNEGAWQPVGSAIMPSLMTCRAVGKSMEQRACRNRITTTVPAGQETTRGENNSHTDRMKRSFGRKAVALAGPRA